MKKVVYAIILVLICTTMYNVDSKATQETDKVILEQTAIDVENYIGSGYSYGAQILNSEGEIVSHLKSADLQSGIMLAFTNLTGDSNEIRILMLSNGQPQKFSVADGEDTYEFSYKVEAESTVYFPLSANPENGYPSRNAEFLFILNTDRIPIDEKDDVCFYTFCHPFKIDDNINEELRISAEPATRDMTMEELEESGDSFYSSVMFVTQQETSNDKLKYQTCEENCRIKVKSSGPVGMYSRLFFINDCLVFQEGRSCDLFSLDENQVFEREYDLPYLFGDSTIYFITVEVNDEGWRSSDTSKIRIIQ